MKTTGNTVLVTGAGTGIGLEMAKLLSRKGNTVIMVARNEERLKSEAAKLKNAVPIVSDLADEKALRSLVLRVKHEFKSLNTILLNAGVAKPYSLLGSENAFEIGKTEMVTNYHSAVYLTQEFESLLADKPEAAMIITMSGVVLAPDLNHPTYSATKAALHSLILSLRQMLVRKKSTIKVFELMLPLVDTPFAKAIQSDDKMSAAEAATHILEGLARDEYEMHLGVVARLYETFLHSPEEAMKAVNAVTN